MFLNMRFFVMFVTAVCVLFLIKDKSVDTFELNKRFLSKSLRNFKKTSFVDSLTPLSPFAMLKYASLILSRGYNIEKGKGGGNVKTGD